MDDNQTVAAKQFDDFVNHPFAAEENRPFLHLERPQSGIRLGRSSGGEQLIRGKGGVGHRVAAADAAR